ncbi:MipA/OmpV family protein [Undibacterium pigrum]|uniref:Outer membrane scaffolding protein for murein synthesis (MipA/OmpV family) n=1 Tax=Undibacterium pigrum TaxID=401470 RepID=A0A318K2X6_9BURK|nr:MipA/OmpV family protein [Undibacterium pigrum]PXX47654.1 outer membrane scaffolding protein for murein synthesis (MipA/OmpV family) [Undibacterium pigrum]
MKHIFKLTAIAFSSLMAMSFSAHAQDKTAAEPESTAVVGAGVFYAPEYIGAKKNRFGPAIYGEYQNKNGFFASTMRGVGFGTKVDDFSFSAALGYRAGREDSRDSKSLFSSDDLKGMGNISGSATANLQASTTFGPGIKASFNANMALSHRENGNAYTFGLAAPVFQTASDKVEIGGNLTYGDAKYNQTYFGVTPTQSANSGYKAYSIKAGFSQATANVAWTHVIDKNWSVRSAVGVSQVMGDAGDSPLAKKKTNPLLISTVNYAF